MRLKHCFALLLSLVHLNYAGPLSQRPRNPYDIPVSEFFDIDPAAVATSPNVNQAVTQVCVDIVYGQGSTSVNCLPLETVPAAGPATQTNLATPVASGNQPGDAPRETEKTGTPASSTIEILSPSPGTTLRCPNGTPKPPAIILIPSIAIPSNLITASPGPLPSSFPTNPTSTPSYLGTRSLFGKDFPFDDDDDDDMDMSMGKSIVSDVESDLFGDDNSASTQAPPPPPPPSPPPPSPSPQSPAQAHSSPSPPLPPPPPPTTASSPTPQPPAPSKPAATAPRVVTKPPEPEVVWTTVAVTETVFVTVTIDKAGGPPTTMSTKASSNTRGQQAPKSKPGQKPAPSQESPPASSVHSHDSHPDLGTKPLMDPGVPIPKTKSTSATTVPASPGTGPAKNPTPSLTTAPKSQKPAPTPAPTSDNFTTFRGAIGLGSGDDKDITESLETQGVVTQDPGKLLGGLNQAGTQVKTNVIEPALGEVGSLLGGGKGDKGDKGDEGDEGKGKGKGKGKDD
ncbi:hypothetical protein FQN50_007437 [Emmonsiellopsis sp. PD_5]|nr:hypothetical protein FQN50_007437 [Emmonsiellopsis sp. PD_5]